MTVSPLKPQIQFQIDGDMVKKKRVLLFRFFFFHTVKVFIYNFKSLETSVMFSLDIFLPTHSSSELRQTLSMFPSEKELSERV